MTLEQRVKAIMGEQAFQIAALATELETAKAKIEELETAARNTLAGEKPKLELVPEAAG